MLCIVVNSIFVLVEADYRARETFHDDPMWFLVDTVFAIIFTIEAIIKIFVLKVAYFKKSWNQFDFALVIVGIFGVVFNIIAGAESQAEGANVASESRLMKFARVFRALRLMRLVRLIRVFQHLSAKFQSMDYSPEVAEHMQKIAVLKCFVKAHISSQWEMIRFFGYEDQVDQAELARCLLQSQVSVFRAVCMAVDQENDLDRRLLRGLENFRDTNSVAEELTQFVMDAHRGGIITQREAQSILHPLKDLIRICTSRIHQTHLGYTDKRRQDGSNGSIKPTSPKAIKHATARWMPLTSPATVMLTMIHRLAHPGTKVLALRMSHLSQFMRKRPSRPHWGCSST